MSLLGLLVLILVFCVVIWAARALLTAFGIGEPLSTVIYVALVIILLLTFLQAVGWGTLGLTDLRR